MKSYKIPTFLVLSALFSLPTLADEAAKEAKSVDPSGTWRWESDQNGQTTKHELKLDANAKHEVTGTYNGLIDDLKSTKGEIKGDKLVLEFDVKRDGYAFTAKYEATIKGDYATGTLFFSSDQGSGDVPWEAKRTLALADMVGSWKMELKTPEGEVHEPTLIIKKNGSEFVASWDGQQLGEFPVKDLKAQDGKFMFTVTGDIQGSSFVGKCVAKPLGSKFTGELALEVGGNTIDLPIAGKLAKAN